MKQMYSNIYHVLWYNLTHVDSTLLDLDEVEPPGLRELEVLHFFFSMTSRVLGYSNGALELINLAFSVSLNPPNPNSYSLQSFEEPVSKANGACQ